jgi:hypothetical protein
MGGASRWLNQNGQQIRSARGSSVDTQLTDLCTVSQAAAPDSRTFVIKLLPWTLERKETAGVDVDLVGKPWRP